MDLFIPRSSLPSTEMLSWQVPWIRHCVSTACFRFQSKLSFQYYMYRDSLFRWDSLLTPYWYLLDLVWPFVNQHTVLLSLISKWINQTLIFFFMNKSNIKFFFSFEFWLHYILHSHRNSPSWQWSQGRGWYIPPSGPLAAPPCLLLPRPLVCCCCMTWLRANQSLCTSWRQEHRLGTPEHLSWPANLTPISE